MTEKPKDFIGACFAPDITDEKLAEYRQLIALHPQTAIADSMQLCLLAVEQWWALPASSRESTRKVMLHRANGDNQRRMVAVPLVPLESDHVHLLDAVLPWEHEIRSMASLFDTIDAATDKKLRDAAFHLLWFVTELSLGREPMTQSVLESARPI